MNRDFVKTACSGVLLPLLFACFTPAHGAGTDFSGDIGLGATRTESPVAGVRNKTNAMPYLSGDYGRVFARVDTFGVQVLPLAAGHIEVLGQYRGDGYRTPQRKRDDSVPFGIGTMQVTSIGAFEARYLHDFGKSGGNLAQVRYITELPFGRISIYPELGVEHQTSNYGNYYYSTTATEAGSLGKAYRAKEGTESFAGAMIATRLTDKWYLNTYVRRTFGDDAMKANPIIAKKNRTSVLVALTYRFQR